MQDILSSYHRLPAQAQEVILGLQVTVWLICKLSGQFNLLTSQLNLTATMLDGGVIGFLASVS